MNSIHYLKHLLIYVTYSIARQKNYWKHLKALQTRASPFIDVTPFCTLTVIHHCTRSILLSESVSGERRGSYGERGSSFSFQKTLFKVGNVHIYILFSKFSNPWPVKITIFIEIVSKGWCVAGTVQRWVTNSSQPRPIVHTTITLVYARTAVLHLRLILAAENGGIVVQIIFADHIRCSISTTVALDALTDHLRILMKLFFLLLLYIGCGSNIIIIVGMAQSGQVRRLCSPSGQLQ